MALILEDGDGIIDANTYQSEQDFKDYFESIGVDVSALTTVQIEAGLIDAGANILEYCFDYKGFITFPDTPQALSFPRTGLISRHGLIIPESGDGSIFAELVKAQAEIARSSALKAADNDRLAYEDNPTSQGSVTKSKLAVLEETYGPAGSEQRTTLTRTAIDYARKLLSPYTTGQFSPFGGDNIASY